MARLFPLFRLRQENRATYIWINLANCTPQAHPSILRLDDCRRRCRRCWGREYTRGTKAGCRF